MKGGIKINMKVKRNLTMAMATVVALCLLWVFVYLYKVSNNKSVQNKGEAYSAYLTQRVEDDFKSIEEIKSANAIVSYDELQNQYSIELSLITDEDINEEQVEMYESILRKTFVEVKLTINGVLKETGSEETVTGGAVSDMLEVGENITGETSIQQQGITESISATVSNVEEGKNYDLTEEEAKIIADIIENGVWSTEGTAECANDCKLIINGRTYYYHSECGTFNDEVNNQNLSVTEEEKKCINEILAHYITLDIYALMCY
jgi:hypothetical protein